MVEVQKEFNHTYEIKKSKFIVYLFPYIDFKKNMQKLRLEHSKARHFVYAYRYLNELHQIVENSSDDGEPKGTSGKPSLAVLNGSNIINTAVIIVRYFGGIRLGTGGLVRAYSNSVNETINISDFTTYEHLLIKRITVKYSDFSKIEYKLKKFEIKIIEKEFDENITLTLEASLDKFNKFN